MTDTVKSDPTYLIDYITGKPVPDVGAEANRQVVARFLVESLGFNKAEIEVDVPLELEIDGENYRSAVDLAVILAGRYLMVFKCAAGSLGSREREILSAARLLTSDQVPLAIVSDGKTAQVYDTLTGKKRGDGLDAIPSRSDLVANAGQLSGRPLSAEQHRREKLIFRTYDSMNVNVSRNR